MDLEAQTLSELRSFLCPIDLYGFREPILLNLCMFLADEGSKSNDFPSEKSAEIIDRFSVEISICSP